MGSSCHGYCFRLGTDDRHFCRLGAFHRYDHVYAACASERQNWFDRSPACLGTLLAGNFAGAFLLAVLFKLGGGGVLLGDGSPAFFAAVAAKISAPAHELFARGIICNWLVCLAIWMSYRTENDAAKVFLIFWPIMIFVAAGFEHCVANMFAFSLALLGPHPATISVYGALHNLVFVTLGNIVGGGIMVAFGYWVQFAGTAQAASPLARSRRIPPASRIG